MLTIRRCACIVDRPGSGCNRVTNRQLIDPALGPDALLLAAESRQDVWKALDQLPAPQRAALVLRYYLDLPELEVADRLGVPAGTAKSRLHHARKRLHALLRPTVASDDVDPTKSADERMRR